MRKITYRPRRYHDLSDLPLFSWADRTSAPPLTMGGYWVRRRTGLPPRIANTVANLAGIGTPYEN
jgi:hypothetical protein